MITAEAVRQQIEDESRGQFIGVPATEQTMIAIRQHAERLIREQERLGIIKPGWRVTSVSLDGKTDVSITLQATRELHTLV